MIYRIERVNCNTRPGRFQKFQGDRNLPGLVLLNLSGDTSGKSTPKNERRLTFIYWNKLVFKGKQDLEGF